MARAAQTQLAGPLIGARTCQPGTNGYATVAMTAQPPDPDPAQTPDLEPGGGVRPGSTPPDSAQTSGLSESGERPRHRMTPTTTFGLIAVAILVLLFVATGVLLVVDMFN